MSDIKNARIILRRGNEADLNADLVEFSELIFIKDKNVLAIKKEDGDFAKFYAGEITGNSSVNISTNYNEEDELINITTTKSSSVTGTISVDNLPAEALTKLVKVENNNEKLLLTGEIVQDGDFVKVRNTNRMYIVYDSSKLGTEEAFEEVTGTAISASYDAADQSILL